MAKVKNVSGQHLNVPAHGGLVLEGQVLDVPDVAVFGLTQQAIWEPVDKAAKDAHDAGENARDEALAAEAAARSGVTPVTADDETEGA